MDSLDPQTNFYSSLKEHTHTHTHSPPRVYIVKSRSQENAFVNLYFQSQSHYGNSPTVGFIVFKICLLELFYSPFTEHHSSRVTEIAF